VHSLRQLVPLIPVLTFLGIKKNEAVIKRADALQTELAERLGKSPESLSIEPITASDMAYMEHVMQNRQNAGKFTSQALQSGNGQRAMGV
jgi:hypothetical protein